MGRKKSVGEISTRINLSLLPSVVEGLDKNIDRLQEFLIRKGVSEKEVQKVVTRSSLIREFAQLLATDDGYNLIKSGFCLALGVVDNGQTELFKD